MSEAEWIAAADVEPLLQWLQRSKRRRPTSRKLQLLANAFADRIADRFTDPISVAIRRFMDRLADDNLTQEEMWDEWRPWWRQLDTIHLDHIHILSWAVGVSVQDPTPAFSPETHVRSVASYIRDMVGSAELTNQTRILRDVIPNPFRPVAFSSSWRTDTAVALARGMYESREFGAMPILADALQDAGCDELAILDHCRDPQQTHVRGCWVVDLVLDKQ